MNTTRQIIKVAELALAGAQALPPAERAEVYEGVAVITSSVHRGISAMAAETANAIREAELRQTLLFETIKEAR